MAVDLDQLQGYVDHGAPAADLERLLYIANRGLQSAELNHQQLLAIARLRAVGDALFRDGAVIRGEPPVFAAAQPGDTTVSVRCLPSRIYLDGMVRQVSAGQLVIPRAGEVQIGVVLTEHVLTEQDDATYRDPAPGTRNHGEPGAARLHRRARWGHSGEGDTGLFCPVYPVKDGAPLATLRDEGSQSPWITDLERYDREANGNYVVEGLEPSVAPHVSGSQTNDYMVRSGVANISGRKIDIPASLRLPTAEDPQIERITAEPQQAAGSIRLNHHPLVAVHELVQIVAATATVTRGGAAGGRDGLPHVGVVSIQSVTQGATVYSEATDFLLDGDVIDWSPVAGAEPASGSTYQVAYQRTRSLVPDAHDIDLQAGRMTVHSVVSGSQVLVDYSWKLPRVDRLCLTIDGELGWVLGVSRRFGVQPPPVPSTLLLLATVTQRWGQTPLLEADGTRAVPYDALQRLIHRVDDLFALVAVERLQRDISSREPTAQRGVFVDPFLDDDLRDQGLSQDAAIVDGELLLPLDPTVLAARPATPLAARDAQGWMLPYVDEVILSQTLATGSSPINPYQAFEPIPAAVSLIPQVDRWVRIQTTWRSALTRRITTIESRGLRSTTSQTTAVRVVNDQTRAAEQLRPIPVRFLAAGFQPGEHLDQLVFDGLDLTPDGVVADSLGRLSGRFRIPSGIPSGIKSVVLLGAQGSRGETRFIGQPRIRTIDQQRINTIVTRRFDPLAQTIRLSSSRWVTAVDVQFMARGNTDHIVVCELRTVEAGVPSQVTLAEGVLAGSDIDTTTGVWSTIRFSQPVFLLAGEEYAIVLLTDDAIHAVAIAELGQFDRTAGSYVTEQPYAIGTLLKSSNASTWTPVQEADMTFRLHAAWFTARERPVDLGMVVISTVERINRSGDVATITSAAPHGLAVGDAVHISGAAQADYNGRHTVVHVPSETTIGVSVSGRPDSPATASAGQQMLVMPAGITDILPLATAELPSADATVVFRYVASDGSVALSAGLDERIALDAVIEQPLRLYAVLQGNTGTISPLLFPAVQTLVASQAEAAIYISRAFSCGAGSRVIVTLQAAITSPASLTVALQNASDGWVNVAQTASRPAQEGWVELDHEISAFTAAGTTTRVRLTLSGTARYRPRVRDLRVVVTGAT
ncbi:MAG: DUF4815 domain-containing protein [Aphanocapsa feldmannii 277cI]|uniref:DUF4815 domain-containing protein n=1 Tax=Aphanocapsa feldmannii 277cI TaxID=2507554 RepID=A0A524RW16_9CHRO|nr:MAG: DUF4815 domain-containing protein [Aphanocapsa feldmannii 277cI]